MMKKILLVSLLSSAVTGVMAQSDNKESGFYVEAGLIQAYYKEPSLNFNNAMGSLKGGYNIDKNFAIEGMYAGNLNSSSGYVGAVYVTAQVQNAYGIYGKAKIDLNDIFAIYAKAGATNGTVSASASFGGNFASAFASGTSPSFGAGVQANISKETYASLEYMSYYNRNSVTIAGPSINVGYKF
jgi:hypothetical protein